MMVLFVQVRTSLPEVYGGEKSTIATARALVAAGHRVHFLLTATDDLAKELAEAGLPYDVIAVGNPFDGLRAASPIEKTRRVRAILRLARAIARTCRTHQVDVVDASGVIALLPGWLGAKLGGARVVFHARGASRNQRTTSLEELSMMLADRTIAVSPSLREQLVGTGRTWLRPLLGRRVAVVPNGFDFAEIDAYIRETPRASARRAVGPEPGRSSALFVGGIWTDKGQLRWLERVLPHVVAQAKDFHVAFVGGTKEPAYLAACQAAVSRLGLAQNVTFTGHKPLREVYAHYQACDLVIMASEREGLPRCAIEAQAFSRPVVATDVVGCADAIRAGSTGIIVPNDRIEEMIDPIVRLVGDEGMRKTMGDAGAAHVRASFRLDQNARALADLFARLR